VGFAVIVAYGIGAMCFLLYGPVNKILPFMLLGIGIDDMFVIIQCWNNLYPSTLTKQSKLSLPERMGNAMKHAGVSITVTSLTDIAAFGVGASTVIRNILWQMEIKINTFLNRREYENTFDYEYRSCPDFNLSAFMPQSE